MPLQATSGAASYDAFGGGVAVEPNYIESVFSTFLYTGNGTTQTINNGIDLAGKGGMVWIKRRDSAFWHNLYDTVRGPTNALYTNNTSAQAANPAGDFLFNSSGFSLNTTDGNTNEPGSPFASWTFREQPKFFDIVTYTGDGSTIRNIPHNLKAEPGFIIIKRTDTSSNWVVSHRFDFGQSAVGLLNSTTAFGTSTSLSNGFPSCSFSSDATFYVEGNTTNTAVNASGGTYVAYLFAHNAGGFGLSGTDNVISCGSFTTDGSGNATVNLGYEPQWILQKRTNGVGAWFMYDTMRGMSYTNNAQLLANSSNAESTEPAYFRPTPTGFTVNAIAASNTYIYIAIRRGPMRTPTTGTSVFAPVAQAGNGSTQNITTGFVTDLVIGGSRTANPIQGFVDRLRGNTNALLPSTTSAEDTSPSGRDLTSFASNTGFTLGFPPFATSFNTNGNNIYWNFRRAPGFFDEVCWTRSTTTATLNHNLGVVPELIIKKDRSRAGTYWDVMPNVSPYDYRYDIYLNDTQAISGPSSIYWNAAPTATTFDVHMGFDGSSNGDTFVAYLFASAPGVSKVGTFTGTGTTQTINCGFTSGARFVLIKAASTSGNWLVWDSARGIVAGNDPYLALNSTAAEVTNTDWVDTAATGFELSNAGGNLANSNGVSYVFFAVA